MKTLIILSALFTLNAGWAMGDSHYRFSNTFHGINAFLIPGILISAVYRFRKRAS